MAESTRERIVSGADRLFYEGGYERTSFAVIAGEVGISRGNFHYHFKTKDDILTAVIDRRRHETEALLAVWKEGGAGPTDRIGRFIDIVLTNQGDIMRFGCPVGSLASELAKIGHTHLDESSLIFELFRGWLREQFEDLGLAYRADQLALHLLARSQGVAVLANVYKDPDFIAREAALMHGWLASLTEQ